MVGKWDRHLALYRDLHREPELAGQERLTAQRFSAALRYAGLAVTTGVGGHGVVGCLANGPGPVVLLRAELDALPVREATGLEYASSGMVMHACGHDLHLAAAAGAAEMLVGVAGTWSGTLVVVGQPAEEALTGAAAMLADGLYRRWPRPDVALAQHVAPLPAGLVGHAAGAGAGAGAVATAGSVTFAVRVFGRGGHAGMPHLALNPITVAGRIAAELAELAVAAHEAVVTVGALHAGTVANAIPEVAELAIGIRALSNPALSATVEAVERLVRERCAEAGCPDPPEIRRVSDSPVQRNDVDAAARVRAAHADAFGARRVISLPPSMATEDFPLLADPGGGRPPVPTVYWMTGGVGPKQWAAAPGASAAEKLSVLPTNHSPRFAPDAEVALPAAASAMAVAALAFLRLPPHTGTVGEVSAD